MRAEAQAVMVGVATVLADDPALTVRHVDGTDPLRVVVDSQLRTPPDAACLPAMIVTTSEDTEASRRLEAAGAEVVQVGADDTGRPSVSALMEYLGARDVIHVLVEGGSEVLGPLADGGWIDEAHVFLAPKLVGGRMALGAVGGEGLPRIPETASLECVETRAVGPDLYWRGVRPRVVERPDS